MIFFINWTHSFNQNLEKEIANLLTLQKPLLVLPSTYYSSRWQLLWLVTAQITLDSLCRATQFSPLQLAQKTYKRNHTLSILLYAQLYAWEIHLCVYTHTHTHTHTNIYIIHLSPYDIPLSEYSMIQSSLFKVNGHLGSFQFGAT